VALRAVCIVHVEMRSVSFLVESQNQGLQFVSGLTLKSLRQFFSGLALKSVTTVFLWFSLKIGGSCFPVWA
jgi:hypothetical protein